MATSALTREDGIGLAVSVAAHAALVAVLLFRPPSGDVVMPPERIEVTLSDEVGLVSTSPDPFEAAAPNVAPVIGEASMPEPETFEPEPLSQPPVSAPPPRPAPRATSRPAPRPSPRPRATSRPRPVSTPAPRPTARSGGSRIGSDFLQGSESSATTGRSSSPQAAEIGPRVRSALAGQISRELKPYWSAPQGPEAEDIVTVLTWTLNRDGSLAGTPRVVGQSGVNDVNRAQAPRHAEQAIRAVQLAAPFDLPFEYYDGWKRISAFRFDKRLSQ